MRDLDGELTGSWPWTEEDLLKYVDKKNNFVFAQARPAPLPSKQTNALCLFGLVLSDLKP